MTSDEVYKLIEANSLTLHGDIEHFAALVASAEREACAKLCDDLDDDIVDGLAGWQYAEAIRARRQA
jgi:hypothetical protein